MKVLMQKPYRFLLLVVFGCSLFCHGYVLKNPITQHHSRRRQQQPLCRTATVVTTTTENEGSSFTDTLLYRLRRNDTSPITVEAYVTSKRSLGKQLVFVDFQTANGDDDLCQAMLRQDYFLGSNYAGYRRCLLKGTKLQVSGVASPTRNPGNVVLLINSIKLLELPRQVQHIQIILQQGKESNIPMEEVRKACHRRDLLLHPPGEDNISEKQWLKDLAKDILATLPEDPNYPKAADQKELSRNGNFVVPKAPNEWQTVPKALLLPTLNQDIPTTDKETIEEALQQKEEDSIAEVLSVSGWVQNRRRFDDNITMISLVDNLTLLSEDTSDVLNVDTDRLACLVHPEYCLLPEGAASLYQKLMAVGAKVWVQGRMVHSEHLGKSILWVQQMRLVQSSSQSVTIRHLLDLLYEKQLGLEEVAEALLMSSDQEAQQELLSLKDATARQWKANQLAVRLQEASSSQSNKQRGRVVKPELLEVMKKYRYISELHPVIPTNIIPAEEEDSDDQKPNNKKNNTLVVMPAIGMPGSKWHSKKRPQLEWMGQQIRLVLQSHPDYGKRKLSILDVGGGKGSLANYLGRAITDVQIHVIDICEGAVANGEQKAKRLNVPVEFQIADASSSSALKEVQADVVVALHACGHLSDVALAHAIQRRAGFVIVPCCFNSNPHLRIPSASSPVRETVPDWLGLPPEDWSALKLLAEVQGNIPLASEAIGILCAVRAEAARKKMISEDNNMEEPDIKIKSFPIEYSTRNTVLVGLCS